MRTLARRLLIEPLARMAVRRWIRHCQRNARHNPAQTQTANLHLDPP